MRKRSLRRRLLALATVTIAAALGLAWLALTFIFDRYVRDHLEQELHESSLWIASNTGWSGSRPLVAEGILDARFERPFGGLYWQIDAAGAASARSRSLWDGALPPPPGNTSGVYEAAGPDSKRLYVHAQRYSVPSPSGDQDVIVLVAADMSEIEEPVAEFSGQLAVGLAIIGLALAAAATAQVAIGLAPLDALRAEVAAVRRRQRLRLGSEVPSEVAPLVEEVNELLAAQDEAIGRARAQAGDLAHGLKTPLTIVGNLAPDLVRAGQSGPAAEIEQQVQAMRRRIDRQLARARLGSGRFATSRLDLLVERLVSLMKRTPHGTRLDWRNEVATELSAPADEVDVAEIVGNLLDNACKWARSVVTVRASGSATGVTICVEDDGPGVPDGELDAIRDRGHKLEEQIEGSGLGLAIVDDLVTAYGGRVAFGRSELGGLKVSISLPAEAGGST